MNINEYLKESARTAASTEGVYLEDFKTDIQLVQDLSALGTSGFLADLTKRNLFYRVPMTGTDMTDRISKQREFLKGQIKSLEDSGEVGDITPEVYDVIHAALGLMSEAGEIIEEVVSAAIEKRPLNKVNLVEEGGDCQWYLAMLYRAIGTDFEKAGQVNIDKLKARYPDKFDAEKAVDRNIEVELGVLETGVAK